MTCELDELVLKILCGSAEWSFCNIKLRQKPTLLSFENTRSVKNFFPLAGQLFFFPSWQAISDNKHRIAKVTFSMRFSPKLK